MKTTIKNLIIALLTLLLVFGGMLYLVSNTINVQAEKETIKDYSFMSESARLIEEKETENGDYRNRKIELNTLIDANKEIIEKEKCKIEKIDENAVCEGL